MSLHERTSTTVRTWIGGKSYKIRFHFMGKDGEPFNLVARVFDNNTAEEIVGPHKYVILQRYYKLAGDIDSFNIVMINWEWLNGKIIEQFHITHTSYRNNSNKRCDIWNLIHLKDRIEFTIRKFPGEAYSCKPSPAPNTVIVGSENDTERESERQNINRFCKELRQKFQQERRDGLLS